VNLDLKNLAGTQRALTIRYLNEKPLTNADFRYYEPWLLGTRLEGELSFSLTIDEENYTRLASRLNVAFPVRDDLKAYVGLSRSSSTYKVYQDKDSSLLTENFTGSQAGVELDLRDFPENPKRGFYLDVPLSIGIKSGGARDYNEFRPGLSAQAYLNPKGAHVIAGSLYLASLFTGDTALSKAELLPLGGTTTLRGYRENQFYGRAVFSAQNEYRYLFGKRARVILFLDAGVVDTDSPYFKNSVRWDAVLVGYGAGLFMRTGAGYLGVDYGLGRSDTFADGKLHLILKNTF
jgi:outer membrane protein insertion porin family